ncbi:MAG TPA: hypothetical protein VG650_08910 [Mycobacteriales bacterium]|nr:hypothetical protein [Mycobacteriales bacterium]
MAAQNPPSPDDPVVVDQWLVVLRADPALPAAAVRRLVATAGAGLADATTALNAEIAALPSRPGLAPRLEIDPRGD